MLIISTELFSYEISPPIQINPDSLEASMPFICVDREGKVWVFYQTGLFTIWAQNFDNETWSEAHKIISSGWMTDNPIVDLDNNIWIFVHNDFEILGKYYNGICWSESIYVPTFPSANFGPRLSLDANGDVWVAWKTDYWGYHAIYARYYRDNVWSDTIRIKRIPNVDCTIKSFFFDRYARLWTLIESIGTNRFIETKTYFEGSWIDSFILWEDDTSSWGASARIIESKNEFHVLLDKKSTTNRIKLIDFNFVYSVDTSSSVEVWNDSLDNNFTTDFSICSDSKSNIWAFMTIDEFFDSRKEKLLLFLRNDTVWEQPITLMDTSDHIWYKVQSIFDPMRDRIWLTWTSERENKYGIYVRYIDIENDSINSSFPIDFYSYPSPFIDKTNIICRVLESKTVKIEIQDLMGRKVKTIFEEGLMRPGFYRYSWDGKNDKGLCLPAGIYIIYLTGENYRESIKTILLK